MEKSNGTSKASTSATARPARASNPEAYLVYVRMATFFILVAGTSFCLVMVQIPSLLFLLYSRKMYRSYIRLTEQLFGSTMVVTCRVLLPNTKLVLSGDFDLVKPKARSIMISNHQIYPDWFYLWVFAWFRGVHGDLKILLMEWLLYLPVFGTGIWFFEFISMKRKWADDKDNMKKHILKANNSSPLTLLLFPEGTLNTPHNIEASKKFAKKNDINDHPAHCLLPKSTGLFFCSDLLKNTVDDVFDITMAYSGLKADQVPYDEYLVDKVFFKGQYPREINLHVEALKLKQLPGFTPEQAATEETTRKDAFNLWLRGIYTRKDARLDRFFKEGTLLLPEEDKKVVPRLTIKVEPELQDYMIILFSWYCASKLVPIYWTIFVFVLRLALWPLFAAIGWN
ncbi:hypothetical protein HDU97_009628 [Phlyctochytrium planicorne]|nr:hypothetical protein HDU97_009628 [Phlyctochytrium planicorne]